MAYFQVGGTTAAPEVTTVKGVRVGEYESQFRRSIEDREAFWLDAAGRIDWVSPPTRALTRAPAVPLVSRRHAEHDPQPLTGTSRTGAPTSRRWSSTRR